MSCYSETRSFEIFLLIIPYLFGAGEFKSLVVNITLAKLLGSLNVGKKRKSKKKILKQQIKHSQREIH